MSDAVHGIRFSEAEALRVFKGITGDRVLLAVLAGVQPEPEWEGCTIHVGSSPPELIQVDVEGPAAGAVLPRLVETLERMGIVTRAAATRLEGGSPLARVHGGRWQSA